MKQIVEKKPEDAVSIEYAVYSLGEGEVIAYISKGSNPTIAILTEHGCNFGFQHLNIVLSQSKRGSLKFCGSSREASIQLALKAGREVYLLEDHHDLIKLIKEKL